MCYELALNKESLKEPYNVLLRDRDQTAHLANVIQTQSVLIFYLPNFHMFGWTQSRTIAWLPKLYIYYLFIFIGSPAPLLATYTWMMDTKCSGFHYLWLDFYLIAFKTHMDSPLAFLSLWFDMSWCPFGTYSYFLFDMLLRGSVDMLEASLGAKHNTKTTSSAGGAGASIWYPRNS